MDDQQIPIDGMLYEPGYVNDKPEDIDEFLAHHGIKEVTYVCTIKRYDKEGGEYSEFLPGSHKNTYPQVDDVGRRFGPGRYHFCFNWKQTNATTGKRESRMKEYVVRLGEEWNDIHDEYMSEKWFQRQKKIETLSQRAKLQRAVKGESLENPAADPKETGLEYLRDAKKIFGELGLPVGMNNNSNNESNNSMQFMQMLLTVMMKSQETITNAQSQSNAQMMTMFTAMLSQNKPQGTNDIMKEVLNLVTSTVDLKNALNPKEETVVDRIFGFMAAMGPTLMELAKKAPADRIADPRYIAANESDDMNAVKNNPAILAKLVEKWDIAHGEDQTDIILKSVGLDRPGTNPRKTAPMMDDAEETITETENPERGVDEYEIDKDLGDVE